MDHDAGVGHGVPLALGAGAQQEGAHGRRQPEAVRLDVASAHLRRAGGLISLTSEVIVEPTWDGLFSVSRLNTGWQKEGFCCWSEMQRATAHAYQRCMDYGRVSRLVIRADAGSTLPDGLPSMLTVWQSQDWTERAGTCMAS